MILNKYRWLPHPEATPQNIYQYCYLSTIPTDRTLQELHIFAFPYAIFFHISAKFHLFSTGSVELVVIISAIPYSAVDKTLVYNGTKKKDKNFDPKDDKVKSAVFWIKYEYFDLLKFSFSLFINFFPLEFAKNFLLYIIAFSIFNF